MGRLELALRLIGMGWYVGFCIIGGAVGGFKLDEYLQNDSHIMSIVGLFIGIIVAVYGVYKMILQNIINQKRNGGKS